MISDSESLEEIEMLRAGGQDALASRFAFYEARLTRMITFRIDHRLLGRIDTGDVLQESFLEVSRRIDSFLVNPEVPFFVWLRQITSQILVDVHRRHLGAKKRDANQEVSMRQGGYSNTTSLSLAHHLIGNLTSPSQAAMRDEMLDEVREALDSLDEVDREVLALRHFEELTNNEVAAVLGLQKAAASNRYVRALKRLRTVLAKLNEFRDFESEES